MTRFLPSRFNGEITQSLLFLFFFSIVDTLMDLPLSYYHHFVMEEKFGFNKMNVKLWLVDKIKTIGLTIALGTPIGSAALWIIRKTGDAFFYYMWIFTFVVSIFFVTIYPIWIVPIFNKLEPLKPGKLKDDINALAGKLKFPLTELQVIDGSKRSSHSNAYFAGLPWKKKIVLFDTLLEQSTDKEVEAVLAHELGHWASSHTMKLLAVNQLNVFFIFALFSAFVNNNSLYDAFGFLKERPIIIGFLLFNEVQAPLESVIKLFMNIMSRTFEFQAGMSPRLSLSLSLSLRSPV
jgi:STE24 endopeptidase